MVILQKKLAVGEIPRKTHLSSYEPLQNAFDKLEAISEQNCIAQTEAVDVPEVVKLPLLSD